MTKKDRWLEGMLVGFALGLGLGALAGGTLGLLLAPEKGKKTRRRIARRAGRWGDRASEVWASTEDLFETGRKKLVS